MIHISKILIAAAVFASGAVSAHQERPGQAVISKAAELAVHRIERLVTLNRLDPMFLSNLKVLTAERVNEGGAIYRITANVEPGAGNQSSSVTMMSDNQGKVLSHTASAKVAPVSPIAWPIKDAVTLFEDALHFVLEGWVQNPPVKAFYLGFMTMTLQALSENGQLVAHFMVTSDDDARTLHIKLKPDGTIISHEIK